MEETLDLDFIRIFAGDALRQGLLDLMLSGQEFSPDQIGRLKYIFSDTPATFKEMVNKDAGAKLSKLQKKRIVRITARKRAVLDYLADSSEHFFKEQVNLFLNSVTKEEMRLPESLGDAGRAA